MTLKIGFVTVLRLAIKLVTRGVDEASLGIAPVTRAAKTRASRRHVALLIARAGRSDSGFDVEATFAAQVDNSAPDRS